MTDAFGDESAAFIRNHADDANPFFLYFAPTAPHDPYEAKQQDLAHFAHISDTTKRTEAAMTYAMDRAIGKVLNALEDPNNDGSMSDSIRDNTVIVYLNDNGGTPFNDNAPLRGSKGLTFEGGIRVPFIINAPGLQPGVYDNPIMSFDLLPTLYAMAGGDVGQLDTDGVDLMPYLSGANTDQPHEVLFWRNVVQWGVRKGDWKFGTPNGAIVNALYNIATDPGETTNVAAQHPDVVADLLHELTEWEAGLDKPKWGIPGLTPYKHFVFRADDFSGGFFNAGVWRDAQTQAVTSLARADSYANLILEFPVKQGASYGTSNNLVRLSGHTYLVNELRFTGVNAVLFNCTGGSGGRCSGGVSGNPFLLVNNLEGSAPKIRLDATSNTAFNFRFDLNTELRLFDDLEITGNGTQEFWIGGAIKDFRDPRNVTKTGTSTVNFTGNNTFAGDLRIQGGQVRLSGASGAINGAASIQIGGAGSLVQSGGLIATHTVHNSSGGSFQFTGGELRVVDFVGNLTNQGGNYSPGASAAASSISGNFVQTASAAKLTMELAGTIPGVSYDQLSIGGTAMLGGTLQVNLLDAFTPNRGDVYVLLDTLGGINGTFADTILPTLGGGLFWRLDYGDFKLRLVVEPQGGGVITPLPGDFNADEIVDSADYVLWRKTFGSTTNLAADGDGDGVVDDDDYGLWRANFGNVAPSGAGHSAAVASIPEPSTLLLILLAALGSAAAHRRRAA